MNRSTLRRLVVSGVTAGLLLTATPALADSPFPRPVQPSSPPGLGRTAVDRPDQAETPRTGRINVDNSFENNNPND